MEYTSGTGPSAHKASLRLVDPDAGDVWEPDPATEVDELDALAELFIGGDEPASAAEPIAEGTPKPSAGAGERTEGRPAGSNASAPPADAPTLEALITGHLPVRGTVWVRAYAARLARELGEPVALVRVSPERTAVELIGSSAETDPVADIGVAIEAARTATDRWLLHFDELDQASLLRTGELDRITVLSGADEPAVVSAYRLLKSLAEETEGGVEAGISIVGSGEAETTRATERIVTAARQFLGLELASRPAVPRIEAVAVTRLGDADRRTEPAEVIRSVLSAERDPRKSIGFGLEPKPGRAGDAARAEPFRDETLQGESLRGEPIEVVRTEWELETISERDSEAESVDLTGDRPDPADLVPDLTGLGLPCPVAPGVSIASDTAGRLHVLAWWSPEAPAALLKAAAWARVNTPLLSAVRGGVKAEACAPAQHIVCTDLAVAADLRGTKTIVHLAQPVDRRPAHGWVCGRVN